MEYVNKSTGEIVKAEELNLANLNKGELDARFQVEIAKADQRAALLQR